MKIRIMFFLALGFTVSGLSVENAMGQGGKKYPTMGTVERFDKRMDDLVPKGAVIEKIIDGHIWTEGTIWVKNGNFLLFSDIPRNSVYKWKEGVGKTLYMKPSGYTGREMRENEKGTDEPGSNGLGIDNAGRLLLCQHGDRQVTRVDGNCNWRVLAGFYQGKRLNSPNDLVVHSNGDIYFTDPPYGLKKAWDDKARELDYCGVYRISAKDGKLTLLTKEMSRPNGIGLSPDEKTLYVANSDAAKAYWKAFEVKADGTLGKSRIFHDATKDFGKPNRKGAPDGMKVDSKGNLFATGPGGVYVFTPKGELLGVINTGERTANCCFGDADGRTLYMATDDYITRIRLNTKGKGF